MKVTLPRELANTDGGEKIPESCLGATRDRVCQRGGCAGAHVEARVWGGPEELSQRGRTSPGRSTCSPALGLVTASSCSRARVSVHDLQVEGLLCHSWAPARARGSPHHIPAFCILYFSCSLWILKLLDLQTHTWVRSGLLPKGRESRHSQLCHLLASCMPRRRQHPVLFYLPAPGPVPRTSLNFFAKAFSLRDVLRVSNAPMSCLHFFPKSSLDNSQFVTQD